MHTIKVEAAELPMILDIERIDEEKDTRKNRRTVYIYA
jgi:hypothetical protein